MAETTGGIFLFYGIERSESKIGSWVSCRKRKYENFKGSSRHILGFGMQGVRRWTIPSFRKIEKKAKDGEKNKLQYAPKTLVRRIFRGAATNHITPAAWTIQTTDGFRDGSSAPATRDQQQQGGKKGKEKRARAASSPGPVRKDPWKRPEIGFLRVRKKKILTVRRGGDTNSGVSRRVCLFKRRKAVLPQRTGQVRRPQPDSLERHPCSFQTVFKEKGGTKIPL